MKSMVMFVCAVLLSATSYATDGWIHYFSNSSIRVDYRYTDCQDEHNGIYQQKVVFRWVNLTGKKVNISFSKVLHYAQRPVTPTDVTYHVTLASGETKTGDCDTSDKSLFIFSKHLRMEGATLTSFDLKNITVQVIE